MTGVQTCSSDLAGIVERFVMEDSVYMPDFVIDEDGILTQVRYDKIMEK